MLKIIVLLADIGYLVKLLSKHYENLENISNFEGWVLTRAAYNKV